MSKFHNRENRRAEKARLETAFALMQQGKTIDPKLLGMVCCSSCGATKVTLHRVTEKCVKPAVYSCDRCLEGLEGLGRHSRRVARMVEVLQSDPSLVQQT